VRPTQFRTWIIGDVTVRKLVESEFTFASGTPGTIVPQATREALAEIPWLYPDFAASDGMLKGAVQAFLVETPTARIVVDTCVGNDKPRASAAFNMLNTSFMEDFTRTGWTRESVTHVVCTHLHLDHVGWNTMLVEGRWIPTFPNASYHMTRVDFEYHTTVTDARRTVIADSVTPVVDAGLVTLVEMDARVLPELRLRPAPGHTPGHVGIVINSAGEHAVISGDVMHHPCQIAHPEWSSELDVDKDLARTSRVAFVADFADKPALVLGTHFPGPTGGRIVRDRDRHLFAPDGGSIALL
jgi:glyoxylase-like metal-dependent hydrolase (beta-lactamase superfamily II)